MTDRKCVVVYGHEDSIGKNCEEKLLSSFSENVASLELAASL